MTAETLRIGRFDARYRLAGAGTGARERLDGVLADVLDRVEGPAVDGIVCLRSVSAPVRLRLDATDAALATVWGGALGLALERAVADGGSGVVRYGSRAEALVDLALGVARRDLGHAWAWRQLGLWRLPDGTGDARIADASAGALRSEPQSIVAVLASVARHGLLPQLLASMSASAVETLADAALAASGTPLLADLAAAAANGYADRDVASAAERVARTSAIAAAAAGALPAVLDARMRRALAALALLETEPGVGSGPAAAAASLVAEIARLLRPAFERPGRAARKPAAAHGASSAAVEELGRDDASPAEPGADDASLAEPGRRDEASLAEPGADARTCAWTEAGGLLHLVHVVDRLGLPRSLQEDPALVARPLRWSLHRLGCLLSGAADDDPAALAFSGLPPESPPPSEDELPAGTAETAALDAAAERIADAVRTALERTGEPAADVLSRVVERRAEIVADPGWIEIRMGLDDVSTELRRTGLDLDPGWVPWLGVVLRFTYV